MVSGWSSLQLKDICNFRRGSFPQPYGNPEWYGGEGAMPFVQVADVNDNLRLVPKTKQTISKLAQPMSVFIPTNSVIVTLQGTIGRVALTQYDAYLDRTVLFFTDYKKEIDARFWSYTIKEKFLDEAKRAPGGIIKTITKQALSSFEIELPPIEEQNQIAEALSDIDNLIDNTEKLIEKKKAIKQGAMQELLTGKRRLPGFNDIWKTYELGELATIKDGTHQTPDYVEYGIPFYSVENVTNNEFANTKYITMEEHLSLSKNVKIEKGDVLMTRIGSIGMCKYVDWEVNASFYVSLALIKCNTLLNPLFFSFLSETDAFQKEVEAHSLQFATPKKINLGQISKVSVYIPASKDEQEALAQIFLDMDNEINTIKHRLNKYRKIKQGMMSKLLTGEIRLAE